MVIYATCFNLRFKPGRVILTPEDRRCINMAVQFIYALPHTLWQNKQSMWRLGFVSWSWNTNVGTDESHITEPILIAGVKYSTVSSPFSSKGDLCLLTMPGWTSPVLRLTIVQHHRLVCSRSCTIRVLRYRWRTEWGLGWNAVFTVYEAKVKNNFCFEVI